MSETEKTKRGKHLNNDGRRNELDDGLSRQRLRDWRREEVGLNRFELGVEDVVLG